MLMILQIENRSPLLLFILKRKLTSRAFVHYMYSSTYTSFSPNSPLLLCCAVCGDRPNEASSAIIVAQSIPHSHSLSTKRVTRICLLSPPPLGPSSLFRSTHAIPRESNTTGEITAYENEFLGTSNHFTGALIISNPNCRMHDDHGNWQLHSVLLDVTGFEMTNSVLMSGFEKPSI